MARAVAADDGFSAFDDVPAAPAEPTVPAAAVEGARRGLRSDCADSASWYYNDDPDKTCEAYVSKKSKNCKKKDEFKVKGEDASAAASRRARSFARHPTSQVPPDLRRVRGRGRVRGQHVLVPEEDEEHVLGLRREEEQELQEEGRVQGQGRGRVGGGVAPRALLRATPDLAGAP